MAPKDDTPGLILRVTSRGIVPAAAIDAETLGALRFGTDLQAKVLKVAPSGPLRAWWGLMSAVVKADPEWISARALSNAVLLKLDMVEEEQLIGGLRRVPMSLRDFNDEQLKRLIEAAKFLIETDLIPGVQVEKLLEWAKGG